MLQARFTNTKLKDEEIKTYANDISITPLSIPMLCGPGAIANGIMLMDDANTWTMKGVLIGMIGLIYLSLILYCGRLLGWFLFLAKLEIM